MFPSALQFCSLPGTGGRHPRTFGILKFLLNINKAATDERQTFAETVNPGGVHDYCADRILLAGPGGYDERVAVDVRVLGGDHVDGKRGIGVARDARLVDGLAARVVAHDAHAGSVQVHRRAARVAH